MRCVFSSRFHSNMVYRFRIASQVGSLPEGDNEEWVPVVRKREDSMNLCSFLTTVVMIKNKVCKGSPQSSEGWSSRSENS